METNQNEIPLRKVVADTLDGVGFAFSSGCMMGGMIYFGIGCFHSPSRRRIYGGLCHVRDRASKFGGSVAMWSFLFNSANGSLAYIR